MPLFNLFKKPLKMQDDTFGEMSYTRFKDPLKNFFEGQGIFKPQQKEIGFIIDADETGPTKAQKDFYNSLQEQYDQIKFYIIPFLNKELVDWYKGRAIENFEEEFELESIELPRIDGKPVNWSIVYVAKKINHWVTIDFIDLAPKASHIDG